MRSRLRVRSYLVILVLAALLPVVTFATIVVAPRACQRVVVSLTRRWPPVERRALRLLDTLARGVVGIRTPAHLLPLVAWTAAACSYEDLALALLGEHAARPIALSSRPLECGLGSFINRC